MPAKKILFFFKTLATCFETLNSLELRVAFTALPPWDKLDKIEFEDGTRLIAPLTFPLITKTLLSPFFWPG